MGDLWDDADGELRARERELNAHSLNEGRVVLTCWCFCAWRRMERMLMRTFRY